MPWIIEVKPSWNTGPTEPGWTEWGPLYDPVTGTPDEAKSTYPTEAEAVALADAVRFMIASGAVGQYDVGAVREVRVRDTDNPAP